MSSNIDHEALIEQQINDDKKIEAALHQRIDKELKEIKAHYQAISGKHPERFETGL